MPSHHTRKRPRAEDTRDRRTSPHVFLSKLDISEHQDQRHVSFTGPTRRQQRKLERKQKRKRKSSSFRVQHDDSALASLSETTAPEYAAEEPLKAPTSVKKQKQESRNKSDLVRTPQENPARGATNRGRIPNRAPQIDSSPPPQEDPDAREARRLERLLGIKSRKTSAKSNNPYSDLFDDTETDLLNLVKSCDDTLKQTSSSTRNVNDNDETATTNRRSYVGSNVDERGEHPSHLSLPASHGDIESESKRSQGGDPDGSGNESEEKVPYVAKWKKKGTKSSGGGSAKELQGLLNRVSAENAANIANRISQLYKMKGLSEEQRDSLLNSHIEFVMEAISQGNTVGSTNPYLRAHVKVLYTIGSTADIRILARFVVALVKGLGSLLESENDFSLVENTARMSRIFGYIVATCAAYEQGVLSSGFICEAFSWIAGPLTKTRVDAELKFVQEVGPLLRKRDPAMFADLFKFVHGRTNREESDHDSEQFSDEMSCKLRMLSDTVENVKNNRTKIAKDVTHHAEESHIYLPFQASLTQLLDDEFAERNWWDNTQDNNANPKQNARKNRETNGNLDDENPRISHLAGALRLRTDGRRSLLAAVVGSVNCSDALHRIERLGVLTSRQKQKDLTHILTQCCGAEQPYNNFYALLAQRVCKRSREVRFALDYTIQDAVKGSSCYESGDNLSRKGANIARYLGDLWASEGLPLAMLRRIPDLEDTDEGERNFYIAALRRMMSQRVATTKDPVAPFMKLKRESEAEDQLFCTALSAFLMRHAQTRMPKLLHPMLSKIVNALERVDEAHNVTD